MRICEGTGNQDGPTKRLLCQECGKKKSNTAFRWQGWRLSGVCRKCLRLRAEAS